MYPFATKESNKVFNTKPYKPILMQTSLEEFSQHKCAHHIYLHLLNPFSRRHLPPHVVSLLQLPDKVVMRALTSSQSGAESSEHAASTTAEPHAGNAAPLQQPELKQQVSHA